MLFNKFDPYQIIKGYDDPNLPTGYKKDLGDLINNGVLNKYTTGAVNNPYPDDINTHFEMPLGLLIVLCLAHRDVMTQSVINRNGHLPV